MRSEPLSVDKSSSWIKDSHMFPSDKFKALPRDPLNIVNIQNLGNCFLKLCISRCNPHDARLEQLSVSLDLFLT